MKRVLFGLMLFAGACGGEDNPIPEIVDAATDAPATDADDSDAVDCTGENECFSCEPVQLTDFLNACTDGTCFPFDNVARLPRFNNGDLPPLP
jgi:hypothetical protein